MADKPTSDLVMMFLDQNNKSVLAESALGVLKDDPFMEGFRAIVDYDEYSNFFEVSTFTFSMSVKPQDESVGALSGHGGGARGAPGAQGGGAAPAHTVSFPGRAPAAHDQFSRWRSAKNDEYKDIRFPIEFDTFNFSRIIDGASPPFFQACCNQHNFRSAALVRRVEIGSRGGGERQAKGFLRLDFRDVALTSINWDDGELVTESVTFICKALKVRYRQQIADSHLLGASEAVWDQDKDGSSNGSKVK